MVPISPQAYSAEAVIFDTKPLFDYAQKLDERRAKRALAEQEAFDEWNRANEKALDSSNLRTQERPLFDKGLQEYRQLSLEAKRNPRDYNKKALAQKKADQLFSLVNKSKNAKEIDKEYISFLRNIHTNPEQRKTTDLDAVLRDKAIHDLPIGFSAPFLGIRRPEDTAPKMNYYKPAPVNTYDLVQKNLAGVELDVPKKVGETDKDFYYKAVQKYKPEGIVAVAERVGKVVSGDPLLQSSYKVKGQQYNSEDMAKLNLLVKSLKDNSGKPLLPNLEVDIDDPVSIAVGEAVEDMIKREKSSNVFDKISFAKYQSNLRKSEKNDEGVSGGAFIDYWAQIKSRPEKSIGEKGTELGRIKGVLVESLTAIPKQRIIDIANKIKGRTFSDEELIIQTLPNGVTRIAEVVRDKFGVPRGVEEVTKIQSEDINIEPQIDVKAKREAVEGAKKSKRTYKIGGKEFTRQQIEQGAKSYGMTFEEYLAAFENE